MFVGLWGKGERKCLCVYVCVSVFVFLNAHKVLWIHTGIYPGRPVQRKENNWPLLSWNREKNKAQLKDCPIEKYGRVLARLDLHGTAKVSQSRLDFLKHFKTKLTWTQNWSTFKSEYTLYSWRCYLLGLAGAYLPFQNELANLKKLDLLLKKTDWCWFLYQSEPAISSFDIIFGKHYFPDSVLKIRMLVY